MAMGLCLRPGAGVGEHDPGLGGDTGAGEFGLGFGDHRAHPPEVRGADRDFGGDHDLLFVADRWALEPCT
jgi:hypothetical protein